MASERIAEVLAAHALWGEILVCECERWHFDAEVDNDPYAGHAAHVAEQLTAAGFGNVPTALHHAADAWDEGAEAAWDRSTPEVNGARYHWRSHGDPANPYRTRADRAGGDGMRITNSIGPGAIVVSDANGRDLIRVSTEDGTVTGDLDNMGEAARLFMDALRGQTSTTRTVGTLTAADLNHTVTVRDTTGRLRRVEHLPDGRSIIQVAAFPESFFTNEPCEVEGT